MVINIKKLLRGVSNGCEFLMVVGDIINNVNAGTGFLYLQPAAGVEIMITSCMGGLDVYCGLSNGVTDVYAIQTQTVNNTMFNIKVGITNTNYLVYVGSTTGGSYSGIQIK